MILGIDIEGRRPTDRPAGDPQTTALVLRVAVGGTAAHLDIREAGRDGKPIAWIQVSAQSLFASPHRGDRRRPGRAKGQWHRAAGSGAMNS
jgi:hypothetical protein